MFVLSTRVFIPLLKYTEKTNGENTRFNLTQEINLFEAEIN